MILKTLGKTLQIAHLKCTLHKHEARKNKPNTSSKLCSDPATCGEIQKTLKGCDTEHGNRCWEPSSWGRNHRPQAPEVIIKWVEKKKLPKSRPDSEQEPLSNLCEILNAEEHLKSFPFIVTKSDGRDLQNC